VAGFRWKQSQLVTVGPDRGRTGEGDEGDPFADQEICGSAGVPDASRGASCATS
jgi:hypothetical protein